jgi:replicative DNA helicase
LNDEEEKYTKACERLSDKSKIYVSTGSKTSNQIRSEVEREHFDAIVIDYLQLIKPSGIYGGNRQAEVGLVEHQVKPRDFAFDNIIGLAVKGEMYNIVKEEVEVATVLA